MELHMKEPPENETASWKSHGNYSKEKIFETDATPGM